MIPRYSRQMPLFGESGQKALSEACVFIAGAGGLGSPVATYLAAAGVGKIILLDFDAVDETNLNRQFLHHEKDIGRQKAVSGSEKLSSQNPHITVLPVCEKLTDKNVSELTGGAGIIVDALDNDETRRVLAKFAFNSRLPYFHAAVYGFSGQVSVFLPDGPCFFCAFPADESNSSCELPENVGKTGTPAKPEKFPISGTVCGVIGSLEANEVVKYITKKGELLSGKLLIWDGLTNSFDQIEFEKDDCCPVCGKCNGENK
ncbi:putative adenylyltransferase/sulfurtransferase MoeZ [Methanosarcinaceae archaeon Ag5]|uniref:Adenylyltransferase/sulfurtransferase MoeZ n=1 Tax=Methanolapillus africanus TaxID=3028297 RepID=A0AAE4SDG8_9EURY|nr:putative adenylyltransferase/sulfurtransferase MoeZ [Methanosarcinaceae archaeon Ag5]